MAIPVLYCVLHFSFLEKTFIRAVKVIIKFHVAVLSSFNRDRKVNADGTLER